MQQPYEEGDYEHCQPDDHNDDGWKYKPTGDIRGHGCKNVAGNIYHCRWNRRDCSGPLVYQVIELTFQSGIQGQAGYENDQPR